MNKVIIAGSRDIDDYQLVERTIKESCFVIDEIISGMATGVDMAGKCYGKIYNIPVREFPADWKTFGKLAGFIRNEEMLKLATHLIAIRKNFSKGTSHMIRIAKEKGIEVFVKDIE